MRVAAVTVGDYALFAHLETLYLGVLADRDMLLQSAINLLSNAIKYTPEGGEISVRFSPWGSDEVRIVVRDSGIGIPAVIAGETGVGMSQRMQSFVVNEAENPYNVVEPGKRPRTTLTPSLAQLPESSCCIPDLPLARTEHENVSRPFTEEFLNSWINNYVLSVDDSSQEMKAKFPLADAKIRAQNQLTRAANITLSQAGDHLMVRVTNLTGHKFISVSGDVVRPDVVLIPFGAHWRYQAGGAPDSGWTDVSFDDVPYICSASCRAVSFPVDTGQMFTIFIGTADKICTLQRSIISDDLNIQADRPQ